MSSYRTSLREEDGIEPPYVVNVNVTRRGGIHAWNSTIQLHRKLQSAHLVDSSILYSSTTRLWNNQAEISREVIQL